MLVEENKFDQTFRPKFKNIPIVYITIYLHYLQPKSIADA